LPTLRQLFGVSATGRQTGSFLQRWRLKRPGTQVNAPRELVFRGPPQQRIAIFLPGTSNIASSHDTIFASYDYVIRLRYEFCSRLQEISFYFNDRWLEISPYYHTGHPCPWSDRLAALAPRVGGSAETAPEGRRSPNWHCVGHCRQVTRKSAQIAPQTP